MLSKFNKKIIRLGLKFKGNSKVLIHIRNHKQVNDIFRKAFKDV